MNNLICICFVIVFLFLTSCNNFSRYDTSIQTITSDEISSNYIECLTENDAVDMVKKAVERSGQEGLDLYYEPDGEYILDETEYFRIHVYSVSNLEFFKGKPLQQMYTFGWFCVDKYNGDVYILDIAMESIQLYSE